MMGCSRKILWECTTCEEERIKKLLENILDTMVYAFLLSLVLSHTFAMIKKKGILLVINNFNWVVLLRTDVRCVMPFDTRKPPSEACSVFSTVTVSSVP